MLKIEVHCPDKLPEKVGSQHNDTGAKPSLSLLSFSMILITRLRVVLVYRDMLLLRAFMHSQKGSSASVALKRQAEAQLSSQSQILGHRRGILQSSQEQHLISSQAYPSLIYITIEQKGMKFGTYS